MYIIAKFDVDEQAIFIPDGFVINTHHLREGFLEWSQEQPIAFTVAPGGVPGYRLSAELFVQYLNTVILSDSTERAYLLGPNHVRRKNFRTISF